MNDDRSTYLGGPDVAVLLGSSDWSTPLGVWLEKTGNAAPQVVKPDFLRWGQLLEPVIAREFAEREGLTIGPGGFRRDPKEPWRAGHADFLAWRGGERGVHQIADAPENDGRRVIEVKNLSRAMLPVWEKGVPLLYQHQAQHYMDLYGLRLATFPVLFGGQLLRTFHLNADTVIQEQIRTECSRFWHDHVLTAVPPPPREVEVTAGVELNAMDAEVVAKILECREAGKAREADEDEAREYLRSLSEQAGCSPLLLGGRVVAAWTEIEASERVVKVAARKQFGIRQASVLRKALDELDTSR